MENGAVALAFFAIFGLILAGLVRDRKLGVNPLGIATALVFVTCASGHALHAEHYLLEPEVYAGDSGLWHLGLVDAFTAVAAAGYLAQRRRYGLVIRGSHPMIDYQRRLQMAEALQDIGQDIAAQTDFERLLRRVVNHARALLGADYAAIVTLDESGKLSHRATGVRNGEWDEAAWADAVFFTEGGKQGSVIASRRPVVVADLAAPSGSSAPVSSLHGAESGRSVLAVPIYRGDQVGGSLMVAYRSVRHLSQDDVSSAAALAGQASIAIEKARLIESLRQADQVKDEFISAAAHELRTPVTAIQGWAEMLMRPERQGVDERKGLETIRRQAERMTRLSEDLLAVVRLQPGPLSLSRERFDLSELLEESVALARRIDGRRDFRLAVIEPLFVEADRHLIAELLGRLLENAARYSPAGMPVEVEARREDANVVVSVADHGIGVSAERRPHIFKPFYEPVPPGKQGYVGIVSLGLHMSKQIVEAHGGRIWLDSTPEGGSTFSFSLSLA